MEKKKFISIVWWYHKQIFHFEKQQNYHMLPIEIMLEKWYECEIYAIDSRVQIEKDPHYISGVTVVYHKGILSYIYYLLKNRKSIFYSNSITLKTLFVWVLVKKSVFYSHAYLFGDSFIKRIIICFFYRFFSRIRVNNYKEAVEINKIKKGGAYICPLVVSDSFYVPDRKEVEKYKGVFLGNLCDIKNPIFLLNAIESLKRKNIYVEISFIWEDRINFLEEIKKRDISDRCKILWHKNPEAIKEIFTEVNFLVNTSLSEWQCLAVYEAALAWKYLLLPYQISFYPVFEENALYHTNQTELEDNIEKIILWNTLNETHLKNNQKMILETYNIHENKKNLYNMFTGI